MWRPHNETPQDLQNEANAAEILRSKWEIDIHKLSPILYGLDWVFSRDGEVVAFAEFKKRGKSYPTYLLSASKVIRMLRTKDEYGVPVILVLELPDGIWYWSIDRGPIDGKGKIQMGGNSRGQNGDTEPVVFIDANLFTKLK